MLGGGGGVAELAVFRRQPNPTAAKLLQPNQTRNGLCKSGIRELLRI